MRLAQPARIDQLLGACPSRLETEFVIDHRHHPLLLGQSHEVARFGDRAGHWLFAQHMFAGLDGGKAMV